MKISRLGEAPDYRFSLANERTFLAWIRTALGFLAAGVGLDQLAPDFATPLIREILALLLCLFAGGMAIYGYLRWLNNEKAMRLKQDLPYTRTLLVISILLLAVVQPLLRVRWEELTWRYETYQREMDRQTEAYQAAYADSLSGDIADRTAAYISEKAASLGIDCRVQVEVRTEDGLPLPYGASLDVERDQVLSDYMAQELGIPASRQSWQPEE